MSKILLIYTGGTIGMVRDYETKSLKPFNFSNLLNKIPEINLIDAELNTFSFEEPIDSSDICIEHWKKLAHIISTNYHSYDGFVVLHGTDTMAYTASALSFAFSGLQKPIIFTGSQLPIGDLRTDAKENLISSIHFAALQHNKVPRIREVCIYFEYKLYRANRTTKMSANHFDAFISPNYPCLGESGVDMEINEPLLYQSQEPYSVNINFSDKVGLIKIFPSINRDFLYASLESKAAEALIIEAFGSGNIFSDNKFYQILRKRVSEGLKLIITTQCLGGGVSLGKYSSSNSLIALQAISAKDMTTEAAITKAMSLLLNYTDNELFKNKFEKNMRGEIK